MEQKIFEKIVLGKFEAKLAAYLAIHPHSQRFGIWFDKNKYFFNKIVEKNLYKELPATFESLFKKIQNIEDPNALPKKIENKTQLYSKPELFGPHVSYLKYKPFALRSPTLVDYLIDRKIEKSDLKANPDSEKYLIKFITTTVLLCALYNLKFSVSAQNKIIVRDLADKDKFPLETLQYYFFYNRSHIEKEAIGVGKLEISFSDAIVEYYYKGRKSNKYETLRTVGKVKWFDSSNILVISDLIDDDDCDKYYKDKGPILSHFIVKHFNKKNENILLGINASWNRDDYYPHATALLVFAQKYYDSKFAEGDYTFQKMKENLSLSRVPPEIYYYLFHQSISLEQFISKDSKTGLTEFDQIPFIDESLLLKKIVGYYRGFTIIKDVGSKIATDYIRVSKLQIDANGKVLLILDEKHNLQTPDVSERSGFIKSITQKKQEINIIISLRYDYGRHINTLNLYLEFNAESQTKNPSGEKLVLSGSYSGHSIFTHHPISAPIIFEEISKKESLNKQSFKPPTIDLKKPKEFLAFKKKYPDIVDFFLTNTYSNHSSIQLLKELMDQSQKKKVENKKLNVFISIPLSSGNNSDEYHVNSQIALEVVKCLNTKYGIPLKSIFCACLEPGNNKTKNYTKYLAANKDVKEFEDNRKNIANSKLFFLVYPKLRKTSKISSAIVEAGYSLGLDNKVMLLCDKNEVNQLPQNLLLLNQLRKFTDSQLKTKSDIKMFFKNETEQTRVVTILEGAGIKIRKKK